MTLHDAKTYKDYYIVIVSDARTKNVIAKYDNINNYTKLGYMDEGRIIVFEKKKEAQTWIDKNIYKGMTEKYSIEKITNCKETKYRWDIIR